MKFQDALTIDAPRKTSDGFLVTRARAARAGVYDYLGSEVDPKGTKFKPNDVVKVYRPEAEVFDKASVHSFIAKPITNDHPSQPVTAANWRDHTRGGVMNALRDGDFLAFDLTIMDAQAVADVEAGKRELSNGYACDLAFEDGTAPDGTAYQAVQRNIRGNHVAIVARGRAGSACRIGDGAPQISDGGNEWSACDAIPEIIQDLKRTRFMNFIMLDELKVDLADADAVKAAVTKLQAAKDAAITAKDEADKKVATLTTESATKDAKIVTLEKQIEDSKLTPAKLRDAAKAYALTVDKAKALGVTVTDEMDEAAIQKAVVAAKLGDAAKDWTDVQIAASFATMTADANVEPRHDPIRAPRAMTTDNSSVRDLVRASQY